MEEWRANTLLNKYSFFVSDNQIVIYRTVVWLAYYRVGIPEDQRVVFVGIYVERQILQSVELL